MTTILDTYDIRPVNIFPAEKLYTRVSPPDNPITSERVVGIEVEVENIHLARSPGLLWANTTDGSLRNNGAEFITEPHIAKYSSFALKDLLEDSLSKECCFSPRTSIHVHVNCQDLTWTQVIDILLLYGCLEEFMYEFVGRGRIKNIYCVPLCDTSCMAYLTTSTKEHVRNHWAKYTGLNILPLSEKGTIEFRHMHGTFDHNKATTWVRLITKLVDYAISQGTPAIRKLTYSFDQSTDVLGLMMDIFGDKDVKHFKNITYDTIKRGVLNTKSAFTKSDSWVNLLKLRTMTAPYYTRGK